MTTHRILPEIVTDPLVSVCIPTYRGAKFLGATIESVLNQSYQNFELLVMDDNSPDETGTVVAAYDDPRILYARNNHNLGPAGNWNLCLEAARGKYYKLLPHDDLLEPSCLAEQVAVMEGDSGEDIALVFGSRRIISPRGATVLSRRPPFPRQSKLESRVVIRACIRAGTNLIGEPGNALVRRTTAKLVGTYDATYPYVVDLDFWCRVLRHGDAYFTGTPASAFRISGQSWSVAIGHGQHLDFDGLVRKLANDPALAISSIDRSLGWASARINTLLRAMAYAIVCRARHTSDVTNASQNSAGPHSAADEH